MNQESSLAAWNKSSLRQIGVMFPCQRNVVQIGAKIGKIHTTAETFEAQHLLDGNTREVVILELAYCFQHLVLSRRPGGIN